MLERVKSYFRHYRSERRGVIVLAIIVFLSIAGVEAFMLLYEPETERIDILLVDANETAQSRDLTGESPTVDQKEKIFFPFNPNTLSDSGYAALGFSEKEIKTLRNYQKAGANFEIKRDFAKLFFVDEEEYLELEPFIELPDSKPKKEYKNYSESFETSTDKPKVKWSDTASTQSYSFKEFTCNLNTADTNELKKLNGIGSFYAKKIIEYREELGGYHSLAQLLELWKMTPEKIDKFANQVVIDQAEVQQIKINSASAFDLSQHPYLSFGEANKIVLKREEAGGFSNSKAFCSSGLLDADLCRKLVPYLNFVE
ncbi:helix-hairpin-helix domain-containing protein [Cryomorphaceae bacterium 1068]|nr:helix-hairpin-helix domain-containing protein [Cryomorphaceae bacterium 1068]